MVSTQPPGKRKPPTFQHLPTNRARKLKQTWVETKKVKSQWRAQKKKEGLLQKRDQPKSESVDVAEDNNNSEKIESDNTKDQGSASGSTKGHHHQRTSSPKNSVQQTIPKREHSQNTQHSQDLSKRELRKLAFSPSSLHTKKSNRNKDSHLDGRKQSKERGHHGKGQPDMKLRMSAMLEKIKRDFS